MQRATMSDLRLRFRELERLLKEGKEIELTKRGKPIAKLVPLLVRPEMPDFLGRMRAMFGDRIFEPSNAELLEEDRNGD